MGITKQQELDILQKAIAKLGPNSYLGPWLTQVSGELKLMITSDLFPDINLNQTAERVRQEREACRNECNLMASEAERAAERIRKEARDQAESVRQNMAFRLREALKQIGA